MAEQATVSLSDIVENIARRSRLVPHLLLRWVGAWVDFIVLALLFLAPDYVLGNDLYQATLPIWLGAAILYFPIGEGVRGEDHRQTGHRHNRRRRDRTCTGTPEGLAQEPAATDTGGVGSRSIEQAPTTW
jgi:hypothetical protein